MTDHKLKAWIGVDPGKTGAAALISDGVVDVFDWPGDSVQAAKEINTWDDDYNICMAIIEKVSAMPKNGAVSMFSFGENFGVWQGILSALFIPFVLVRPQDWQKGLIPKKKDNDVKSQSLTVARRMFPNADLTLKKHHGRADAILMAYTAYKRFSF